MAVPHGYWAAIRLTAFANCEISEANWRTLWTAARQTGFRRARPPKTTAARPGFVPEDLRSAIWASILTAGARAPKEWEVLDAREEVATLKAMQLPAADAMLRRYAPIEESPYRPWPRRGRTGRHLGYEELCVLHRRTRERLTSLCAGDWRPLILVLRRRRFPSLRLVFFRHHQLGRVPAAVPCPEASLALHLDRLFLDTLVAGLWGRFYRCERCGYFGVRRRLGKRGRQLCDRSKCRVARHRTKKKAEEKALRTKVVAAWRACREPNKFEVVRKQFGLTPREMNRFLS